MANEVTCPHCSATYTIGADSEHRCPQCGYLVSAVGKGAEATPRRDSAATTPPPPPPPARPGHPPAAAQASPRAGSGKKQPTAAPAQSIPRTAMSRASATKAQTASSLTPTAAGGGKTLIEPATAAVPAGKSTELLDPTIVNQRVDEAWGATIRTLPPDASSGMTIKQEKSKADIHASRYRVQRRLFGDIRQPTTAAADFKIEKVLGEGGMGIVYTAVQSSMDRRIALKMIKGDAAKTPGAKDKFLAEAVVTGDLEHPNIVPVYELGMNEQ